jgi:hypothetical protein
LFEVITWRARLILDAMQCWYTTGAGRDTAVPVLGLAKVFLIGARRILARLPRLLPTTAAPTRNDGDPDWGGYFNIHSSLFHGRLSPTAYRFRGVLLLGWAFWHALTVFGTRRTVAMVGEWLAWRLTPFGSSRRRAAPAESLRLTVRTLTQPPATTSERSMEPLRSGR